jgi:UDP-N-acetylmuramoyl-tripeptide--D-alanyl-D-alanine ligase
MSFSSLSKALGAALFAGEGKQGEGKNEGFSSVSIDSRTVRPGALFVALRGNALDGHKFVDAAFGAGASAAMVGVSALQNPAFGLTGLAQKWNRVLIAVEDTLKALQNAAGAYLRQFSNLLRIGITGSSGKTTTKEIASAIIGQEKSVIMNKGNLNSETGLPLSVFEVRPHHQVGIFEAGMNKPGEIADLAAVLDPNLALITNIGSAHIGIFGSRQAIAEEKKKIFSCFSGVNTALIPENDDYRDFLAKDINGRVVFYGPSSLGALGAHGPLGEFRDMGLHGTEIVWEGESARFGLPGRFNLANALAATALALELGISAGSVRRGIESVKPLFGRGEILYGRTTVIRDCYNSNPESVEEALDFCDSLEWPGRRIYVMGSMLELGDASEKAHADLGKRLALCKAGIVFLFGEEIQAAAETMKKEAADLLSLYTKDRDELSRALDSSVKSGDLVLLKGSRGCELETLTAMLLGESHVS